MPITPLTRAIVAQNKWTTIAHETFETANGRTGDYLIVERGPALMVIALVRDGGDWYTFLVRQHRYPIDRTIWQFPMGTLDQDADPYAHAAEEFRQETGAAADQLTLAGEFFVDPGLSRQTCLVFIAEGVREGGAQQLEDTEAGLQSQRVSLRELEALVARNELNDSWGYAGIHFLNRYMAAKTQV